MPVSHRRAKPRRLPSTRGWAARLSYKKALAERVDVAPLLKGAGLTAQQLRGQKSWIAVRDQARFINLVADALSDDCLGFTLARTFDPRQIGLYYYVIASSGTVAEALQRGARYTAIVNEGISQTLRAGRRYTLQFHYVAISRHLDRHQIEFWMAGLILALRQLTGVRVVPVRVRLVHRRKDCPADYSEVFGRNLEFSAPVDEIVFDKHTGDLPLVDADPHLNKMLLEYCEQALTHRHRGRSSFHEAVENAIVPLLPHGKARVDLVAHELGVSQRTFARKLASEGLTFSQVLEKLRNDLAKRYLADQELSVSQTAWLLGYREVGAFSHAFKRWTGKTPRETRGRLH